MNTERRTDARGESTEEAMEGGGAWTCAWLFPTLHDAHKLAASRASAGMPVFFFLSSVSFLRCFVVGAVLFCGLCVVFGVRFGGVARFFALHIASCFFSSVRFRFFVLVMFVVR